MDRNLLKLSLNIEVQTANLDPFTDAVYITLSDTPKAWPFQTGQEAAKVVNCIQKLFWESTSCAVAQSGDRITSEVSIDIQCAEFSGGFHQQLLDENSKHFSWAPELSKHLAQVSEQFRHELAEMLHGLAKAYYAGASTKSGEHYAFSLRY